MERKIQFVFAIFLCHWSACSADFDLTILHNNDIHGRYPAITEQSSLCRPEKQTCMAGTARTVHLVNEIRANRTNQVLFLSAGDFYQGSIWHTEYKYKVANDFVFKMGYVYVYVSRPKCLLFKWQRSKRVKE